MTARQRAQVALAYLAFVIVGISAGVGGVLLPAQVTDYGVDRARIGLTFFTFAGGFLLSSAVFGGIVHRFGLRWTLTAGSVATILAGLATASRPPFAALVLVQVISGTGTGIMEAALNTHLARLPGAAALLGRLHACFGAGALTGPLLATWILRAHPWTTVALLVALAFGPVAAGAVVAYRGGTDPVPDPVPAPGPPSRERRFSAVLRQPSVLLASGFLAVYVGMEISIGNWGYSYLVGERHQSGFTASNAVSGFWLGLTAGRFVIQPLAARLRWADSRTSAFCLAAIAACGTAIWTAPADLVATAGLGVTGFFLGPLFPTTMAMMPLLTAPRYVATAIGVLNGVSSLGGSALPWLAGALTQAAGLWLLMPYVVALALVQLILWHRLTSRRPGPSR